MKIQVQCRHGGDPRTFLVGARRLQVMRVLERVDGREFVLRHDLHTDDWRLASVRARQR